MERLPKKTKTGINNRLVNTVHQLIGITFSAYVLFFIYANEVAETDPLLANAALLAARGAHLMTANSTFQGFGYYLLTNITDI
ncbi:hypothetical protein JCM39194_14410 [Desulfotomaculum varum]